MTSLIKMRIRQAMSVVELNINTNTNKHRQLTNAKYNAGFRRLPRARRRSHIRVGG
jgi:hypothetical protein